MNNWQRKDATFIRTGGFTSVRTVRGTGARRGTTMGWTRVVTLCLTVSRAGYIDMEMNALCWLWLVRNCK